MDKLERGATVLVKTSNRGEVERVVWEDAGGTVYLCSPRQFDALNNGINAPTPIGFPRDDVCER
jgi:hypothetical protein